MAASSDRRHPVVNVNSAAEQEHSRLHALARRDLKLALALDERGLPSEALKPYTDARGLLRRATRLDFGGASLSREARENQDAMLGLLAMIEERLEVIQKSLAAAQAVDVGETSSGGGKDSSSAAAKAGASSSDPNGPSLLSRVRSLFSSSDSVEQPNSAVQQQQQQQPAQQRQVAQQPKVIDLTRGEEPASPRPLSSSGNTHTAFGTATVTPRNVADTNQFESSSRASVTTPRENVASGAPKSAAIVHKAPAPAPVADKRRPIPGIDQATQHRILDEILLSDENISFDDVAGLKDAKEALQEMLILPLLRPDIFSGLRSPARGLLLFGPPGNGKTFLARAVASKCGAHFFNVSASTLTSKWHGEAEKMVRALFALAREISGPQKASILFIDEIDSLLTARGGEGGSEHEASRRLKTQFLIEADGVASGGSERVMLLAATNRPQDLDDAVLRRFPRRIYVPLPDAETREALLRHELEKAGPHTRVSLSSRDLAKVAALTEHFSGSDIKNLCRDAAMQPVRELGTEALVRVAAHELRAINVSDFEKSLQRIHPSANPDQIKALEEWNRQFGAL